MPLYTPPYSFRLFEARDLGKLDHPRSPFFDEAVNGWRTPAERFDFGTVLHSEGPALSLVSGDRVIACGGVSPIQNNADCAFLWWFFSTGAFWYWVPLHIVAKRLVNAQQVSLMAYSDIRNRAAHCWLRLLGFKAVQRSQDFTESKQIHLYRRDPS